MKNKYGEILQNIRLSKNMTLSEVSAENLSTSFLSKFERSETDISLTRFVQLLDELNFTIDEFLALAEQEELSEMKRLMYDLAEAYYQNNLLKLSKLKETQMSKWYSTNKKRYRLNAIMVDAYIAYMSGKKLDDSEIKCMIDYLFGVENWGKYELTIYGNSLSALPLNTIFLFSNEILKRTNQYGSVSDNYRHLVSIVINTVYTCFDNDAIKEGKKYLDMLKKMPLSEVMLFERIEIKFLNALYLIHSGEHKVGKKLGLEVLDILSKLDAESLMLRREADLKLVIDSTI